FEQHDDAREAMIDLEIKGIDADAIHLVPPTPPVVSGEAVLATDVEVAGRIARRSAKGGLFGALMAVAVVVGFLTLMQVEPMGTALLVGVAGGAVGGFSIGAFWGAASRLPVNEEVF